MRRWFKSLLAQVNLLEEMNESKKKRLKLLEGQMVGPSCLPKCRIHLTANAVNLLYVQRRGAESTKSFKSTVAL